MEIFNLLNNEKRWITIFKKAAFLRVIGSGDGTARI